MPSTQLNSTAIKSLDYDPRSRTLIVTFTSGKQHQYDGISQQTYDDFASAESAGRYYHENIKR